MAGRTSGLNNSMLRLYTPARVGLPLAFGTCCLSQETTPRGAGNNALDRSFIQTHGIRFFTIEREAHNAKELNYSELSSVRCRVLKRTQRNW